MFKFNFMDVCIITNLMTHCCVGLSCILLNYSDKIWNIFRIIFFQRELESPTPKRQRLSGSDVFDPMRPSPTLTPSPSRRRNRWDPNPETCLTPRSYHHRNSQFIHLPYHRRSPPHLRRSTRHRDKNGELTEVTC